MVPRSRRARRVLFGPGNESTVPAVRSYGGLTLAPGIRAGSLAPVLAIILQFGIARAQPAPPAKPSDAPLPSCLDQTIRDQLGAELKPRGVQKRDFKKDGKIVLHAHGGLYGGDLTSSSWLAGGSLGFFFTEDLGVQAEFDVTPLTLDLDAPLDRFFGDNRFEPGLAYIALANMMWSPIHAKLKLGGGIVHADIIVFAGGGRMIHDAVQGLSFDGGFALELLVSRAMTIRLDARDLTAVQEIAGETRFTNNLVATAGIAFYIPSGL
jgi:outer membrane beta-barrel protein